jgi:hypothetical protein
LAHRYLLPLAVGCTGYILDQGVLKQAARITTETVWHEENALGLPCPERRKLRYDELIEERA